MKAQRIRRRTALRQCMHVLLAGNSQACSFRLFLLHQSDSHPFLFSSLRHSLSVCLSCPRTHSAVHACLQSCWHHRHAPLAGWSALFLSGHDTSPKEDFKRDEREIIELTAQTSLDTMSCFRREGREDLPAFSLLKDLGAVFGGSMS